jgi:LmbE family N-acetylglucosaminyl deacetylase
LAYRLMCITAHPDDECGAFGGALLMAHSAGIETTVICLTEGQAGSHRGTATTGEELAEVRRAEFAAAGEVLGISRGEVLHFPDGKLYKHDHTELISVLVERIRQWRPQVVLTFGGDGNVNLHRDHTVVSLAATAAFHWAGRSTAFPEQLDRGMAVYWPQKLYYAATSFLMVKSDEERENACSTPYSLNLELGGYAEKKLEAFLKHTTQIAVLDKARSILEDSLSIERYLLVAARGPREVTADESLFQGVFED